MSVLLVLFACAGAPTETPAPTPPVTETPAPTPAPEPPPAPTPAPAECKLDGKWTGTLPAGPQPWNGKPMNGEFKADGIFDAGGPMGTRSASWKLEGGVLTVDKSTATGPGVCKNEDVGHYKATFAADCNTVTFEKVDDTCPGREHGLVGYTLTRG